MAKKSSAGTSSRLLPRQWLNIMIISVSAMFLLSMLVGRMMNVSNTEEAKVAASLDSAGELVQIDFGLLHLSKTSSGWQASDARLSQATTNNAAALWLALLQRSDHQLIKQPLSGKTVLLYFSQLSSPVVCKVIKSKKNIDIVFVKSGLGISLAPSQYSAYLPLTEADY